MGKGRGDVGRAPSKTARDAARAPGAGRRSPETSSATLDLQSQAGNRAVTSLIGGIVAQRGKNTAGWGGADARGKGWNTQTHVVGTVRRVPVDGLKLGNQVASKGDEKNKTTESAAGRAIVLIPAGVTPGQKVDVLLHFHGFTHRSWDPHAGWRQHSGSGTVRDVDQDRIESQLQAAKTTQMIAVLPQGVGGSEFGPGRTFPVDDYLTEVFQRLNEIGEPPRKTPGPPMTRGQLILSGHSGGGDDVGHLLGTTTGAGAAEVILFEAIHSGGLKTVGDWAIGHLERVRRVLASKTASAPEKAAVVAGCPKLVAYYSEYNKDVPGSGGYAGRYTKLKKRLDTWFGDNASVLGLHHDELRGRFRVEGIEGASHETIVRGLGDDPTAGPLFDALAAYKDPTAPSTLATKGSSTWVRPSGAPRATPAAPAPRPKASRSPAPTPARILAIATARGLTSFQLLAMLPKLFSGGDGRRVLAEVLVAGGLRDEVEITDILFAEARGGGRIPDDRPDLAAEWVELRRRYAKPALQARQPASATDPAETVTTPTTPAPATVDPATVRPAKAATGARPLADEQRAAALKAALEQGRTTGTKKARSQLEAVLAHNNTNLDTWYGDIVFDATFLDVPITPSGGVIRGVHRDLYRQLQLAESGLVKTFKGLSKAQIAGKMGIYQISGVRPPKAATGKSNISYHSFGLAIDINHPTNPFVGNQRPTLRKDATEEDKKKHELYLNSRSPRIIARAMQLLRHEDFDVEKPIAVPKGKDPYAARLWEVHHRASETLAEYLRLADALDSAKLRGLVNALPAGAGPRDLDYWKKRIADDRILIKEWDFEHHKSPEKGGYMDLGKELVVALVEADLLWGGSYGGAKDIMHFDYRKTLARPKGK